MTQRLFQPSFAGGELSPALYGRVDMSKYAIGLKRCRNFLVHRTGGVSNRAGFQFLGAVADEATLPMLVPFRFNTSADQVAVLEFGNHTMRVWFQGALITDASGAVLTIATPAPPRPPNWAGCSRGTCCIWLTPTTRRTSFRGCRGASGPFPPWTLPPAKQPPAG